MKKLTFILLLVGCASRPLTPDVNDVKASRDAPSGQCEEIGRVTGTAQNRKTSNDQLLQDLKAEAARKGANFVKVDQYSDYGTAVTGTAYLCK